MITTLYDSCQKEILAALCIVSQCGLDPEVSDKHLYDEQNVKSRVSLVLSKWWTQYFIVVHGPVLQAGADTTIKRLQTLAAGVLPVFMMVTAARRPFGAFALDVFRGRIEATRRFPDAAGRAAEHIKPAPKGEPPQKWDNYNACLLLAALRGTSK